MKTILGILGLLLILKSAESLFKFFRLLFIDANSLTVLTIIEAFFALVIILYYLKIFYSSLSIYYKVYFGTPTANQELDN